MREDRTIPRAHLVRLLSSALGEEKSQEVISTAARMQGLSGVTFSPDEVRELFQVLAKADGLVGVVARFALSRGDVEALASEPPLSVREGSLRPPSSPGVDILPLLAPALGMEKARDAAEASARRLGLDLANLSRDDAVTLLDDMAKCEGIVGVVARFAKARFLLM